MSYVLITKDGFYNMEGATANGVVKPDSGVYNVQKVTEFLKSSGSGTMIVNMDAKPSTPVVKPVPSGKRVLIEVGHGGDEFGAESQGIREYDLNWITARVAQQTLVNAGIQVTITDNNGELYDIGRLSSGYDLFLSCHHNAMNGKIQGAEVCVHKTKHDPEDVKFAAILATALAKEFNITDRGVKSDRMLGVLSGSEDTNCKISVLMEPFFMDAVPKVDMKNWSERAGLVAARTIIKYFSN